MTDRSRVDLLVVGAGAAGLAAAKTARELGLEVVVFEAMDRVGGRAYTRCEPFGFPWDAGCHWLHSASINPFTRIAEAEGFRYRAEPTPWHAWLDGRSSTEAEEAAIDAYCDHCAATIARHGATGDDLPVMDAIDLRSPWLNVFRAQIDAEWGVSLQKASTLDISRYRDTNQNWPVESGYGALVARAASSALADVVLETPVQAIQTRPAGVRVLTSRGIVEAKAAIITVSTDVLAGDAIAFDPVLPLWKREAFVAVPLGQANKIALQVEEWVLDGMTEQSFGVPIGAEQMINLRFRPYGRNLIDGYVAGPFSAELEAEGEAAMLETATSAMAEILGNDAKRGIIATAVSRWESERTIRGGYGAALPGQADRRADLGRSVDDRIFFAGEATSPAFFSTCHGAWETGIAAVRAAAEAIKGEPVGVA